jgi:hypothetical protein
MRRRGIPLLLEAQSTHIEVLSRVRATYYAIMVNNALMPSAG